MHGTLCLSRILSHNAAISSISDLVASVTDKNRRRDEHGYQINQEMSLIEIMLKIKVKDKRQPAFLFCGIDFLFNCRVKFLLLF
jgi:hypothetical protein